jgi:hypothetical protein
MATKHYITYKRYEEKRGIGEYADKNRRKPPQWLLDKIADEKFSGGFELKRKNLCRECFEYKSANGSCGCDA